MSSVNTGTKAADSAACENRFENRLGTWEASVKADAAGNFDASLGPAPVTLALEGPFVIVHNHEFWPEGDLRVEATPDERFALMKEVFQKTPLGLNVAYISWGEDGLWAKLGWKRPN